MANWRIESLGRDSDSGSEEEFFDCQGEYLCVFKFEACNESVTEEMGDVSSLAKWSSLDLLTEEDGDASSPCTAADKNGELLEF